MKNISSLIPISPIGSAPSSVSRAGLIKQTGSKGEKSLVAKLPQVIAGSPPLRVFSANRSYG